MAGGAPTKYNAEFHPLLVEALARNGLTDKEMADKLNIAESTFHLWKKEHAEFSESIKKGKAGPDEEVEQALYKRALGSKVKEEKIVFEEGKPSTYELEKEYPPDTAAAFIWLKNRRPDKWRDKHEVEHSGELIVNFDPAEKDL